jgi:hypothetical protein
LALPKHAAKATSNSPAIINKIQFISIWCLKKFYEVIVFFLK